jgi:polyhydroxyalkanoate synthase
VFRNDLLELIQYKPITEQVHERPLLVVPPQINKFYVFDLSPEKSVARFLLRNGVQTFVVSWRNPTKAQREWGLSTYIEALKEAIDVVTSITGSPDINMLGACSGGITTASLLGHYAAIGEKKVNSPTPSWIPRSPCSPTRKPSRLPSAAPTRPAFWKARTWPRCSPGCAPTT